MAVVLTLKFKNGGVVHIDDEFAVKGNRLETDKYIITKDPNYRWEDNPNIKEVIRYDK